MIRGRPLWYNFAVLSLGGACPCLPTLPEVTMKRLITLLALLSLTLAFQAQAQVPRTPLVEMGSATW